MKSKKIDKLRYEDYEGAEVCLNLCQFLETLSIKSASDSAQEFYEGLNEFCPECHIIKDVCGCNERYSYRYYDNDDGDRAYDAWKDAQMEARIDDEN